MFFKFSPMAAINTGGACYMPGTLSELIFANTSGPTADGTLTNTHSPITAGSDISVSGTDISNTHTFAG